jgi:DNA uptake protein ComE-like DNA-binding protein
MIRIAKIICAASVLAMAAAGPSLAQRPRLAPPAGTPMATVHANPNAATAAQLAAARLPPALVSDIVAKRPFRTQADFAKVVAAHVPEAQRPAIYAAAFVPIDLNTATAEEIMTIPGMTARMVHEFEEYRPYRDISQFDREIGKYVDPPEVARLRSYVTVR